MKILEHRTGDISGTFLYTGNLVCWTHFLHTGQTEYILQEPKTCNYLQVTFPADFLHVAYTSKIYHVAIQCKIHSYKNYTFSIRFTKCINNLFLNCNISL